MTLVDIFNALGDIGWDNVFIVLILIILITNLSTEGIKKFFNNIGYENTKVRLEKERDEKIEKLDTEYKKLETKIEKLETENAKLHKYIKKIEDNMTGYREQSLQIQNHWTQSIGSITDTQKELIKKIDNLAEQNRKYQLADIRETLLQAYRYYTSESTNSLRMWTEIESSAFWEQYETYKDNGGNGYMESVVRPEMNKLKVISLDDYDKISELMSSRTQCRN